MRLKSACEQISVSALHFPWQVGRTLAESLHQGAGGGSLHRMAVSATDASAAPPPPHTNWHSYYNELALQLIAATTAAGMAVEPSSYVSYMRHHSCFLSRPDSAGGQKTACLSCGSPAVIFAVGASSLWRAPDAPTVARIGTGVGSATLAVMPNGGAPANALQALERAAAAAATPLAYQPAELLQLMAEHLRASGLDASADTLTGEARLTPSPASTARRPAEQPAGAAAAEALPAKAPAAGVAATVHAADEGDGPPQAAGRDGSGVAGGDGPPSAKRRRLSVARGLQAALAASGASASSPEVGGGGNCGLHVAPQSSISPQSPGWAAGAPRPPRQPPLPPPRSTVQTAAMPQTAARVACGDAAWLNRLSPMPATEAPAARPVFMSSLLAKLPSRPARQHRAGSPTNGPAAGSISPMESSATPFAGGGGSAGQVEGAATSRLHGMVMAHLRAQHESACAAAANPISTLAPISLLEPHVLPEVTLCLSDVQLPPP